MRRRLLPPSPATLRGFGVVAGSLVAGCALVASASDLGGIMYRYSIEPLSVLSSHSGQVRKLVLVLLPPHQRVCVVGHLLHFHVGLKVGFPFERGRVEIYGCGTNAREVVQIARCWAAPSSSFNSPSVGWM